MKNLVCIIILALIPSFVFAAGPMQPGSSYPGVIGDGSSGLLITGKVGIGITAPLVPLEVSLNTSGNLTTPTAGTTARFTGADGSAARIEVASFGNYASYQLYRANGTDSSPSAFLINDEIGRISVRGYGATGYSTASRGSVSQYAAENWTDSAQGTYIGFRTTQAGTIVTSMVAKIDGKGHYSVTQPLGTTIYGSVTCSGANWTGSGQGPWTHTTGATTALTCSVSHTAGQAYLLTYPLSGTGGTLGVTPSFGGQTCAKKTTDGTFTCWEPATATTALTFVPDSTFTGAVGVLIMQPQGPSLAGCNAGAATLQQGSNDQAGTVTNATTACVVAFQGSYTNTASCGFTAQNAITGYPYISSPSNTAFTANATGLTSFTYECNGLNE